MSSVPSDKVVSFAKGAPYFSPGPQNPGAPAADLRMLRECACHGTFGKMGGALWACLLYTSPSPRDRSLS
eukprot:1667787-Pyramimonas_sp.AAC.1